MNRRPPARDGARGELPLSLVAVVGPPAAGKSTLTQALIGRYACRVFRLREFADLYQQDTPNPTMFATSDPLGWFSDEAVDELLRAALLQGRCAGQGLVVLEGFPGNGTQLHLLAATARLAGGTLTLIELDVPDDVVSGRAACRRVCAGCDPSRHGGPRHPAVPAAADPGRCGQCAGRLSRRETDEPAVVAARLQRYRTRLPDIRDAATVLGLPYQVIDATMTPLATANAVALVVCAALPARVMTPTEGALR